MEQFNIEIPFGAFDSEFVRDEYYIPEGCEARIEGNKVIIERVQKEEELTEFEKELKAMVQDVERGDFIDESLGFWKNRLLDLARSKTLKDLPKLEKSKACIDSTIPVMYTNAASMKTYVEYNGYTLCINDVFEKLPKEE